MAATAPIPAAAAAAAAAVALPPRDIRYFEHDILTGYGDPSNRSLLYNIYTLLTTGFSVQTTLDTFQLPDPLRSMDEKFLDPHRGTTGFPTPAGNTATVNRIKYCAMYTHDDDTIVLSACLVVHKVTEPKGLRSYEIWSLASNPLYLRVGAAQLLLEMIFVRVRVSKDEIPIYLSIAADSYPFLTFYDRLLFYANLGFNCVDTSMVRLIDREISLRDLQFTSFMDKRIAGEDPAPSGESMIDDDDRSPPIFTEPIQDRSFENDDSSLASPLLDRSSRVATLLGIFPGYPIELSRIRKYIPLMQPIPTHNYIMKVIPRHMNYNVLYFRTIILRLIDRIPYWFKGIYHDRRFNYATLVEKRIREHKAALHRVADPAATIGFLSHGAITTNKDTTPQIISYRLPKLVEVFVCNTPGFVTSSVLNKHPWDAFLRYWRYIPIELLKLYFPGVRPIRDLSGTEYLPAPSPVAKGTLPTPHCIDYMNSIAASLRVRLTGVPDVEPSPLSQFSAYGPGDLLPDLLLTTEARTETRKKLADHLDPISGLYDLKDSPEMRSWTFDELSPGMATFDEYFERTTSDGNDMLSTICAAGKPDVSKKHTFAEVCGGITFPSNGRNYYYTRLSELSEFIVKLNPTTRTRIFIACCGEDTERDINPRIQELTTIVSGRTIDIPWDINVDSFYRAFLMSMGDVIVNRVLNTLLGATVRIQYNPITIAAEARQYRADTTELYAKLSLLLKPVAATVEEEDTLGGSRTHRRTIRRTIRRRLQKRKYKHKRYTRNVRLRRSVNYLTH